VTTLLYDKIKFSSHSVTTNLVSRLVALVIIAQTNCKSGNNTVRYSAQKQVSHDLALPWCRQMGLRWLTLPVYWLYLIYWEYFSAGIIDALESWCLRCMCVFLILLVLPFHGIKHVSEILAHREIKHNKRIRVVQFFHDWKGFRSPNLLTCSGVRPKSTILKSKSRLWSMN